MLEGAFFRVLSINAPRGLRCVSDDVSNLPQAADDQQLQVIGARPLGYRCTPCRAPASPAPIVSCLPRRVIFTTFRGLPSCILRRWTRPTIGPAGPLSCRSPAHGDGRAPDSHLPRFTRWVCSRSNVEVTCNRAGRHVRRAPRFRLSG